MGCAQNNPAYIGNMTAFLNSSLATSTATWTVIMDHYQLWGECPLPPRVTRRHRALPSVVSRSSCVSGFLAALPRCNARLSAGASCRSGVSAAYGDNSSAGYGGYGNNAANYPGNSGTSATGGSTGCWATIKALVEKYNPVMWLNGHGAWANNEA